MAAPGSWRATRVHRVRDLDLGAALAFWTVVVVVASAPLISALVVLRQGWRPAGDNALIGLRISDVLHGRWPLLGQPSTGQNFGSGIETNHPGPIEFYLIAPLVALLGPASGLALGAAAINASAMGASAWVAFRRGGIELMLLASVLLLALSRSLGGNFLHDPVSSQVGAMASLVVVLCAWSIVAGDLRMVPLFLIASTFALQDHLAYFGTTGPVVGVGIVGAAAWWYRSSRRRHGAKSAGGAGGAKSADDAGGAKSAGGAEEGGDDVTVLSARTLSIVAAACTLLWLPVILDELFGAGNLGAVYRTFTGKRTATEGLDFATQRLSWAVGPWPIIARVTRPLQQMTPPSQAGVIGSLLLAATLAFTTTVAWKRRRTDLVALASVTAAAALAGLYTAVKLPLGAGIQPSNLRWMWLVSLLIWLTVLWQVWCLLQERSRRQVGLALLPGVLLAVLVLWTVTVGSVGRATDRDGELAKALPGFSTSVIDGLPDGNYRVVYKGTQVVATVGPALVYELDRNGYDLLLDVGPFTRAYSKSRRFNEQDVDGTLIISSERGGIPADAKFVASLRFPADPYSDQAGQVIEVRVFVSPDGSARIR